MELKAYLRILFRKWWIVLIASIITFTSTAWLTFNQVPTYKAVATLIVAPSIEDVGDFVDSLNILGARVEISSTYAEIAESRQIESLATDELGLSSEQRRGLSVDARIKPGTNVLEIIVHGNSPIVVRDFANAIGANTLTHVRQLQEIYKLEPLDRAEAPKSPIKPNRRLNLILGALCGLALGAGLAFLSEYLQTPENASSFGTLDGETGMYNKPYFMQMLGQEVSRAGRNQHPLSLALINVDHLGVLNMCSPQARSEALHEVAKLLKQDLRREDIMARFDETIFAFLLPDMPGEIAKETIERMQTRVALTPIGLDRGNGQLNLVGTAGVSVAYQQNNGRGADELLIQAMRALKKAETADYQEVCVLY